MWSVVQVAICDWLICAWCSWEMALNVGLDASFDKMWYLKGIQEKAEKVNKNESCYNKWWDSRWILTGSYIGFLVSLFASPPSLPLPWPKLSNLLHPRCAWDVTCSEFAFRHCVTKKQPAHPDWPSSFPQFSTNLTAPTQFPILGGLKQEGHISPELAASAHRLKFTFIWICGYGCDCGQLLWKWGIGVG
jgi:hypothetical protein